MKVENIIIQKLDFIKKIQDFIMKMVQEIMKIFHNINIIIGLGIVSFIIFIRLFYIRLPRELFKNLPIELLIIYIIIIIGLIISILISTYLILKDYSWIKHKQQSSNNYFSFIHNNLLLTLFNKLRAIYDKGLQSLDIFIKYYIITKWLFVGIYIIKKTTYYIKYQYLRYLNWISDFIPKLIVASLFTIDVMFYHKFNYFYKGTALLLLPLLYMYILYTIKSICEINLNDAEHIFIIIDISKASNLTPIEYFKIQTRNALLNPKLTDLMYQEDYLITENLKHYQFGWTHEYIHKNQLKFKDFTADQLTNAFFISYIQFNQLFVYPSICLFEITINKHIENNWIRLLTSIIYLINWIFILQYGISLK